MKPTKKFPSFSFVATPVGVAIALGIGALSLRDRIESQVELPWGFRLKDAAKTDAVLPSNLKIVGFDDRFVASFQRTDLTMSEWASLFKALSERGVEKIYVDKRFSFVNDKGSAANFVEQVDALPAKIVAASWTRPFALVAEQMIDLKSGYVTPFSQEEATAVERAYQIERGNVYGPNLQLTQAFDGIGHINYSGDGRVDAFTMTSTGHLIPNLGLALSDLEIGAGGEVTADGRSLPVDGRGKLVLDFPSYTSLLGRVLSVEPLVKMMARGRTLDVFMPGDRVLLVPSFFTGSGDVVTTPRGQLPGGFVWATTLANLMADRFISPLPGGAAIYLLFPLLVALTALVLPARLVLLAVGAVGTILVTSAGAALTYGNVLVPWAAPLVCSVLAAVVTIGLRHQRAEREITRIRRGLEGIVPAPQLQKLTQDPSVAQVDVVGKVVTVMFVDVVGFSKFAGSQSPRETYDMLKSLLTEIIDIVHGHGGCVDRVLGDGLLCYFGHDHTTQAYDGNHAQQAVNCAVAIQRRFLVAGDDMSQKLPLRIGINTCPVVFGDLGSASRRDATLIGDGVNFAKRLESACDLYRVCISSTTRSMLVATPDGVELRRRLIPVKHKAEAIEAFEIEPNAERVGARRDAVRRYYEFLGLSRSDQRYQTAGAGVDLLLHGQRVPLRNVSTRGVAVELVDYWAHGVSLHFELKATSEAIQAELERFGLTTIIGEVRWAEPVTNTMFLHGVLIKNLSDRQRAALNAILVGDNVKQLDYRKAG